MALLAKNGGDTTRVRELYIEAHRVYTVALGPTHKKTP